MALMEMVAGDWSPEQVRLAVSMVAKRGRLAAAELRPVGGSALSKRVVLQTNRAVKARSLWVATGRYELLYRAGRVRVLSEPAKGSAARLVAAAASSMAALWGHLVADLRLWPTDDEIVDEITARISDALRLGLHDWRLGWGKRVRVRAVAYGVPLRRPRLNEGPFVVEFPVLRPDSPWSHAHRRRFEAYGVTLVPQAVLKGIGRYRARSLEYFRLLEQEARACAVHRVRPSPTLVSLTPVRGADKARRSP